MCWFERVFEAIMGAICIVMLLTVLMMALAGIGMVGIACYRELLYVWAG